MQETKQKLIKAAIILFALNDIESVSVAKINEIAQVHNKSAIYYHFKSKWGLAEATIHYVLDAYVEDVTQRLARIDQGNVRVEHVVDAMMKPMIKVLLQQDGYYMLKFFSRLVSAGDQGRCLIAEILTPITQQAMTLLLVAVPDANEDAMSMKVLFSFNSMINILSDGGLERFWPTRVQDHQLIGHYIRDYIVGGILYKADAEYVSEKQ